jgi:hypothetical protein
MQPTYRTKIRWKGDTRVWWERRCRWCGVASWALKARDN